MRKLFFIYIGLAVLGQGGCSDDVDVFRGETGEAGRISFSIEEADVWLPTTRGCEGDALPSPFDPEIIPLGNTEGDPLYLHVSAMPTRTMPEATADEDTRGTMISGIGNDAIIGLIAYKCDSDGNHSTTPDFDTYLYHDGSDWIPADKSLRWTDNNGYEFYAYYPYSDHAAFTIDSTGETPTITYTNQTSVAADSDLLVAHIKATEGTVNLPFTHPLATVVFKPSPTDFRDCTITSLTFGDVSEAGLFDSSAQFSFGYGASSDGNVSNPIWSKIEGKKCNFSLDIANPVSKEDSQIGGRSQTIMVIPTEGNKGLSPKINLTMDIDGARYSTPEGGLAVPSFPIQAGHTTTYVISNKNEVEISDPILKVPEKLVVSHLGGSETLNVTSTVKVDGVVMPIGWSAEIILDEIDVQQKSDSISIIGGFPDSEIQIKVLRQDSISDDQHYLRLQNNTNKHGRAQDYDLSTDFGTGSPQNTSNCYIVNRAGTYKLPLVYGNAIKDGAFNTTCGIVKNTETTTSSGALFVDYKGDQISNEKITGATKAILLWHDASTLGDFNSEAKIITVDGKISSEGEYDYVKFEVSDDSKTLQQANAVIAVGCEDESGKFQIIWSWHIWVTDIDPQIDVMKCKDSSKGESAEVYTAFKYPLGYCSGPGTVYYPKRSFKIRLTQDKCKNLEALTKDIIVEQLYHENASNNNVVMYQYRRKDPFVASSDRESPDPKVYDTNNKTTWIGKKKVTEKDEKGNVINTSYVDDIKYETLKKSYWNPEYSLSKLNKSVPINEGILHPNEFYYECTEEGDNFNDKCWYSGNTNQHRLLWNSAWTKNDGEYSNNSHKKTIYDPCPSGYMVPPCSFWQIWTDNKNPRGNSVEGNNLLSSKKSVYGGVWLWCYGVDSNNIVVKEGDQFFLSANGRINGGHTDRVGSFCQYWSTGYHGDGGHRFYVDTQNVKMSDAGTSAGASVLPVAEM